MLNRSCLLRGLVLGVGVFVLSAAHAEHPRSLDLETAIVLARENNRVLQAVRWRVEEARGDLAGARLRFVNNPEFVVAAGPRVPGLSTEKTATDIDAALEQRFEIGGQRRHRIDQANAAVLATQANTDDVVRIVELATATEFFEALAAGQRLELMQEYSQLASELHEMARLRLEQGEGTPLELNTARIRLAESQRRTAGARTQYQTSRIELATLLGLDPETPLSVAGELPTSEIPDSESALVAAALVNRPDVIGLEHEVFAAEAATELADAEAHPDITAGLFYGREADEDIYLLGVRVPLPLSNRNQGQRRRTRASLSRLRSESEAQRLEVNSEVRRAYRTYEQAREATRIYDADVLHAQEESLELLRRAFQAGAVDYSQVIVVQREVLEGREGFLDTRLSLALARAQLLAAAHRPQSVQGGTP